MYSGASRTSNVALPSSRSRVHDVRAYDAEKLAPVMRSKRTPTPMRSGALALRSVESLRCTSRPKPRRSDPAMTTPRTGVSSTPPETAVPE